MASASIESTVTAPVAKPTVTNASRDDLEVNDVVLLDSVNNGVAYNWSLAYVPEGSTATFSGSDLAKSPGSFTADKVGPYLVRLVLWVPTVTVIAAPIAAGSTLTINGVTLTAVAGARTSGANDFNGSLGTASAIAAEIVAALNDGANSFSTFITPTVAVGSAELNLCPVVSGASITAVSSTSLMFFNANAASEQFVRLRALTTIGALKLVAAGERVDTVPVPVDITLTGWADEQNFNLLTLLGFISTTSASGRVVYVDPIAGDYNTIQAAMNYANTQGPSASVPWVVLVRPGTYTEDLVFYPFVHLFGWPGGQSTKLVRITNATTASHTVPVTLVGDEVVLSNLYFDQPSASANPVLTVAGAGTVTLHKTALLSDGAGSPQGAALSVAATATLNAFDSRFSSNSAASSASTSLEVAAGATANLRNCRILVRGLSLAEGSSAFLRDCEVLVTGTYGIRSLGTSLVVEYSQVTGATSQDIAINPAAAGAAGAVGAIIRWSRIGDLLFDTTGIVGSTSLLFGATEHGTFTFPGGSPATLNASTPSDSIFYDNSTTGIVAENVQDALDEIYTFAAAVRTLDDAYDGGDPGPTGSGRTIVADAGAVQIVDAVAPSDPIPPGNTDGGLDVVGRIRVGAIDKPEISLDPNPFGNGPEILLGQEIWAPDAPNGSTGLILGNATGTPGFRNYNLQVGTKSADGGVQVGSLTLKAGDSLDSGVNAGHVYIQSGEGTDGGGGNAGSIFLVPAPSAGGTDGRLWLVRGQDGTPATLTAAGVFVGGVTGQIRFGTNMGAIEVDIDAADNLAAVQAKFNATGFVTATGNPITLTTTATGITAEVFFLNADTGVDVALGGFASQSPVDGTWPTRIDVQVSAQGEITFGNSFANPMIYNAQTGKLTVPGLIDPIGLILEQTVPLTAPTNKGVLYIEDGSGSGNEGDLVYVYENGVTQNISAVIGGAVGFNIEDEGVLVPGGPHTTLNFIGSGVTATDAGGGVADVTIISGGGSVAGVQQDAFAAASFNIGGPGSFIALTQTYDTNAALRGLVLLFRNGAADMVNVGPAAPTLETEYRINGNNLEIGTNITATGNTYILVYPRT
jgi:hypothetical protein